MTRNSIGAVLTGAALFLFLAPVPVRAQALKLASLKLSSETVVGPWVSYRVRSQSRALPVRQYTQRVAIVAKEAGGLWVELKTEGMPSGRRIERGFFAPPSSGRGAYRLERYQVLHSNGKLFEYPPERIQAVRSEGDVTTIELFEYDAAIPPAVENLGADTLRVGQRVVPVEGERTLRAGANAWQVPKDTSYVNRPLLVQTVWKNTSVPITGLARSLFQVVTEQVPSTDRSVAPTGSSAPPVPPYDPVATAAPTPAATGTGAAATPPGAAHTDNATVMSGSPPFAPTYTQVPTTPKRPVTMLSWTDLVLSDLGNDAKPEVTQEPEPLPEDTPPQTGIR